MSGFTECQLDFCDAETERGSAYCPEHISIWRECYLPDDAALPMKNVKSALNSFHDDMGSKRRDDCVGY